MRIQRSRATGSCQSSTPNVASRLVYIRAQLGMAAHIVDPSTAMAPIRKMTLAHSPRVSV
jgi:hypothetical protein